MRQPAWQANLADELARAARTPFRWGRHDCCQFVARCIRAVTAEDRRVMFAPYRTKHEAASILEVNGGMRGLLTHALGESVHPSRAGQGDIVLVDFGRGEQPAVCMGVKCFAPGRRGLETRDTLSATAAWII